MLVNRTFEIKYRAVENRRENAGERKKLEGKISPMIEMIILRILL